MKLPRTLTGTLEEWARITGLGLALADLEGNLCLQNQAGAELPKSWKKLAEDLAEKEAPSAFGSELGIYKVRSEGRVSFFLLVFGSHPSRETIGELAVCQVESLLTAAARPKDKSAFFQDLLLGSLNPGEAARQAGRLMMDLTLPRTVFLVEIRDGQSEEALSTIRNIFSSGSKAICFSMPDGRIAIVRDAAPKETEKDRLSIARTIADTLEAEVMTAAWVSFGRTASSVESFAEAWKQALTALEIGKLFYLPQRVFSYRYLGIGRLICHLPEDVCDLFMEEIFGEEGPAQVEAESLETVRTLFENNLNLSETARQLFVHRNTLAYRLEKLQKKTGLDVRTFEDAITFKIALMVAQWRKKEQQVR